MTRGDWARAALSAALTLGLILAAGWALGGCDQEDPTTPADALGTYMELDLPKAVAGSTVTSTPRQYFLAIGTPENHSVWQRVSSDHPWRFNKSATLEWRIFEGPDIESAVQAGGGILRANITILEPRRRSPKDPDIQDNAGGDN